MNKEQLIKIVANRVLELSQRPDTFIRPISQRDLVIILDTIIDEIESTVAAGEKVHIGGLGTFEVTEYAAREGKNPRTAEPMVIGDTKTPRFRAAQKFKDKVRG